MKLPFPLLLAFAMASAAASEQSPSNLIDGYLERPDVPGEVFTQARQFDSFDYRSVLAPAAKKDRRALLTLLQYNERTTLRGAGGEDHASILVALLEIWGDDAFASVLQQTSPKAVEETLGFLEYGGASRVVFPATYSTTGREERAN
jgi:hypothetical protein